MTQPLRASRYTHQWHNTTHNPPPFMHTIRTGCTISASMQCTIQSHQPTNHNAQQQQQQQKQKRWRTFIDGKMPAPSPGVLTLNGVRRARFRNASRVVKRSSRGRKRTLRPLPSAGGAAKTRDPAIPSNRTTLRKDMAEKHVTPSAVTVARCPRSSAPCFHGGSIRMGQLLNLGTLAVAVSLRCRVAAPVPCLSCMRLASHGSWPPRSSLARAAATTRPRSSSRTSKTPPPRCRRCRLSRAMCSARC